MSAEHPMILFVGHAIQGAQLLESVEPLNWWIYQSHTANEALGMYVSYLPDLILMNADAEPDIAEEVYFHLASVQAEPIIVISDDEVWSDRVSHHLPSNARVEEIVACVAEVSGALDLTH